MSDWTGDLKDLPPVRHVRALATSWRGWVILVFVAVQLLWPLEYYVGRRDPHDERFAWRMFSPMRMTTCAPVFDVAGEPVRLDSEFHEAWIELAKRGRFVVIEAMAQHLCAQHPDASVDVTLTCKYVDHPDRTFHGSDMCHHPLL